MTDKNDVVILGSARTPQGKFLGALSSLSAAELGQIAVRAAVERSGIDSADIDEVILGNVVSAGVGQALPRQVSIAAGIPDHVGGMSVNKICGSGLKSVMLAANAIKAEDGSLYVTGGVESMSRAPYLNDSVRQGNKYGAVQLRDALQVDGLWCALCDWSMGSAAEFIGRQLEITREAMDAFALRSHQLAAEATDSDKFQAEIVPVTVRTRKGETTISQDESIRRDTTLEALSALKPAFEQDGSVTAGNAPGMND
ncbi:MAG: acetyl-CoA C-acyltransferase, partial [Anaerolineae bacterium]|nr:acetyl-CoA C-acyltransferase [Anaerolineae bacterium]